MLNFNFGRAYFEGNAVRTDYDLEIGVVAKFKIQVVNRVIYEEDMFPIVELRIALDRWVRRGPSDADFEFVSMESDDVGLIWIRRQVSGCWRVGSIHQDEPALDEFAWQQVADAARQYIVEVDRWVLTNLGVIVSDFVQI